jgi:hypothetical protein
MRGRQGGRKGEGKTKQECESVKEKKAEKDLE